MRAYYRLVNYDEFARRNESQFAACKGESTLNLTDLMDSCRRMDCASTLSAMHKYSTVTKTHNVFVIQYMPAEYRIFYKCEMLPCVEIDIVILSDCQYYFC